MGRERKTKRRRDCFTNWKAEETINFTFNDEWGSGTTTSKINSGGFSQYALPGYPASHSCLRLQERDARYLYDWADQWVLADSTVKVKERQ
jgi:hypothetical protein